MAIGVTTATEPSATFVASQPPPMPTSMMATSTGASAKAAYATATRTSKNVIRGPPSAADLASTISMNGSTSS